MAQPVTDISQLVQAVRHRNAFEASEVPTATGSSHEQKNAFYSQCAGEAATNIRKRSIARPHCFQTCSACTHRVYACSTGVRIPSGCFARFSPGTFCTGVESSGQFQCTEAKSSLLSASFWTCSVDEKHSSKRG